MRLNYFLIPKSSNIYSKYKIEYSQALDADITRFKKENRELRQQFELLRKNHEDLKVSVHSCMQWAMIIFFFQKRDSCMVLFLPNNKMFVIFFLVVCFLHQSHVIVLCVPVQEQAKSVWRVENSMSWKPSEYYLINRLNERVSIESYRLNLGTTVWHIVL